MADTTATSTGSTAVQPPVAAPVTTPPAIVETAEELKFSREALDKRLERERTKGAESAAKALGFESIAAMQAWKKAADEVTQAADAKKREEMAELDRLKADLADRDTKLAAEKTAREAAEQSAEAARTEAHLQGLFATKGITATDYAFFKIEQALNALPDGQELDEVAFLDGLLKDPREAFALGIANAAPPKSQPATTTAPATGPGPKPTVPTDGQHASQMTPEQWSAWKRTHGIG